MSYGGRQRRTITRRGEAWQRDGDGRRWRWGARSRGGKEEREWAARAGGGCKRCEGGGVVRRSGDELGWRRRADVVGDRGWCLTVAGTKKEREIREEFGHGWKGEREKREKRGERRGKCEVMGELRGWGPLVGLPPIAGGADDLRRARAKVAGPRRGLATIVLVIVFLPSTKSKTKMELQLLIPDGRDLNP